MHREADSADDLVATVIGVSALILGGTSVALLGGALVWSFFA